MGQNFAAATVLNPAGGVGYLHVDSNGALETVSVGEASNAVGLSASSGDVAAGTATANLTGNATTTPYLAGILISGTGATAAGVVDATVSGLQGGNLTIPVVVPAGNTTGITPVQLNFSPPLKGAAENGTITVSVGSFGSGNLHAAVNAWGFRE